MRHFDVIIKGSITNRDNYECLMTGKPCGLISVTLRKMILIPPLWIGRKITIDLPLCERPLLATWQYLRMLRWIVTLLVAGVTAKAVFSLLRTQNLALHFTILAVFFVSLWWIFGIVLDKFEKIRLARYDKKTSAVTLRFTSSEAARRASEMLSIVKPEGERG